MSSPSSGRIPWSSWLVPPILVPLLLIILVVAYGICRTGL
jgi:hypothetical protein